MTSGGWWHKPMHELYGLVPIKGCIVVDMYRVKVICYFHIELQIHAAQ